MTEQNIRNEQYETATTLRVVVHLVLYLLSLAIAIVAGYLIYNVILSPLEWREFLTGLLKVLNGKEEVEDFLKSTTYVGIEKPLETARILISVLGGAVFCLVTIAIWFVLDFRGRVKNIDRVNQAIMGSISNVYGVLENLESRHNVIQKGTDFGRVLALRDFTNRDLREDDAWYNDKLTIDHCIVSTLILDRAEELLTSEHYMSFFVDLTPPKFHYFRLVLARRPKDSQGLSAYGVISNKLKYKTAILSITCWRETLKPALRDKLVPEVYDGVVHLIERNTELGIKGAKLEELTKVRLHGTTYAGRIEKLEAEKKNDALTTIASFLDYDHSAIKEITGGAVEAYWRLMGLIYQNFTMTDFSSPALDKRFSGDIDQELGRKVRAEFATAP